MTYIQERGSTHVYHVNRMSKEEMDHMISLCVHEQPAYCVAACPFKMDTKEMLYYAAKGNFKKALAIYEKITPFPMILCDGCDCPVWRTGKTKQCISHEKEEKGSNLWFWIISTVSCRGTGKENVSYDNLL